jgi:hypothetical protein
MNLITIIRLSYYYSDLTSSIAESLLFPLSRINDVEFYILGYIAVQSVETLRTFRGDISPPSLWSTNQETSVNQVEDRSQRVQTGSAAHQTS